MSRTSAIGDPRTQGQRHRLPPRNGPVRALCGWLKENGGRHLGSFPGPRGDDRLESWAFGDGAKRRLLLVHQNDFGWDVFAPVANSILVSDVYAALKAFKEDPTPCPTD